jgi:Leucine-rich repeat (LRR) protein
MSGIKSLSEVKNPSMFIQWRFSDRKLTDLNGIGQFKNLTDLDISGNLLQSEI